MSDRDREVEEMLSWIREIVSFGVRRPGYPADLETERWLAARFEEAGLADVRLEPVPVNRWRPSRTELVFPGDGAWLDCCAVPYTAWTRPTGVRAPIVFAGDGAPEELEDLDIEGKAVVVEARFGDLPAGQLRAAARFAVDVEDTIPDGSLHAATFLIENFDAYYASLERGAAAFIGVLADMPIDGCDFWVPYDGYLKDLPAVWVGREDGTQLRRRDGAEVVLTSVGSCDEVDSHNVVGVVPGRGDEHIILTCHHDAPWASAVEDASGLAVLLALARRFAREPRALERSLVFVASSGHFHGGVGNRVFVERHREDLVPRTVAAIGVEHIAEEAVGDERGGYRLTGLPEMRALFVDAGQRLVDLLRECVERHGLDRTLALPATVFGPEPPCDAAPFFTAGIPSVCHISGPLYLFDPHDTVDKVRVPDLPRVTNLVDDLVRGIDGLSAAELEEGMQRRRGDPPPEAPRWFRPPP